MSNDITQTLYQKASTGKVYQWSIKIEENTDTKQVFIITTRGYIDGKKTESKREVPKGKAGRTKLEQATLEATRKWINKHEKEGYQPSLDTASKAATKGTTTSSNFLTIRPMLAQTYGKVSKPELPYYVQRKYDGLRCIASYNPTTKTVELKTRNNKPYHHLATIRADCAKIFEHTPSNFHLDGELYTNDIPFEEISGIARKQTIGKEDIKKMEYLKYHIYDCVDLDNLKMTNTERVVTLQTLFKKTKFPKSLRLVSTYIVKTEDELARHHNDFVKDGYEGTMIRDPNGHYQINKRSKFLQKYKDFMEDEYEIIGADEETGDNEGCVIWKCQTSDGKPFSCTQNGTREYRRELFSNIEKYIGKPLTVTFQELTADGIPRFPKGKAVRIDKD